MEFTKYNDAISWWSSPNTKIKTLVFHLKDCDTCDDFVQDVFFAIIENEFSEHFEVIQVDINDPEIMFPPQSNPTVYFDIPNAKDDMPLLRIGGTTPDALRSDLSAMIDIKENGTTIKDAFANTQYESVSLWIQRQLRF